MWMLHACAIAYTRTTFITYIHPFLHRESGDARQVKSRLQIHERESSVLVIIGYGTMVSHVVSFMWVGCTNANE